MTYELNPRQDKFARLYCAGPDELQGNATRAYMAAYPDCTYESAATNAHRLLKHEGVRARIRELREEAAEEAKARARDWWELYPSAQETLRKAANGEPPGETPQDKRSAVEAAKEIVARCLGSVKQQHEFQVQGQQIVAHVLGPSYEDAEAEEGGQALPARGPRIEPADGAE